MAFQISPGVNISELDLTTVIPSVATTDAAIGGIFRWGPVGERVLVDSEKSLVERFGKPTNVNAETFFSAANFLSYSNRLYVARGAAMTNADSTSTSFSSVAVLGGATLSNSTLLAASVKNKTDYESKTFSNTDVLYVAKYPGAMGNSLKISVCDTANAYSSNVSTSSADFTISVGETSSAVVFDEAANTSANTFADSFQVGDNILVGNSTIGLQYLKVSSITNTSNATNTIVTLNYSTVYRLKEDFTSNTTVQRFWEYYNVIGTAPGQSTWQATNGNTSAQDELHVVVEDEDGEFSGAAGTILEVFQGLSRATDARNENNTINYYKEVINESSRYIWFANDITGAASNTALNLATSTNVEPTTISMAQGADGLTESTATLSVIAEAYDLFSSAENVDVSLIIQGKPIGGSTTVNDETVTNYQLANYIIDNICETRKDCIALISPEKSKVVNNIGSEAASVKNWRGAVRNSSYAVMDSGYKYQYDRYNDVYRWVPLNGDIAGLCARTDATNDAWWSPAGFNRGNIKNVIKLAWNPSLAERDVLYPSGVNPVVSFPGQGVVLFGDKTLQAKPSAFDRINVRRLFIVLEKAISTASKFSLFEFNDPFTRSQFKNLVTPYLRNIQGRRGITDFLVVCDDTNNTSQIIDTNQFVGDIYIKPARSINFIQLNFVAVGSGVQFSEVVGVN